MSKCNPERLDYLRRRVETLRGRLARWKSAADGAFTTDEIEDLELEMLAAKAELAEAEEQS